jgi:pimeloyl-ACP methyl ester carboxylesterase
MKTDDRSRWVDLGGPTHYLDFGGPPDGPIIVAVHGLAGSSLNWLSLAPLLTDRYRMLAPDLAGHGLTRPLGRGTTVPANRLLLSRFIAAVPAAPVILLGNSMGGMISLLQAATEPPSVAGLILVDAAFPFGPALPHPLVTGLFGLYALPGVGPLVMSRRRSMSAQRQVALVLRLCCVRADRIDPDVVAAHVALAGRRNGFEGVDRDMLFSARSVVSTAGARPGTRYRQAVRSVTAPALLIHGAQDRLVPVAASVAMARRRPDWQLVVLPDIGHLPQMEAPAATAEAIRQWLTGPGTRAARLAQHGYVTTTLEVDHDSTS